MNKKDYKSDSESSLDEPLETSKQSKKKNVFDKKWNLSTKRRAYFGKFNGKVFFNIREFYKDFSSGIEKPGKKGISLTIDQLEELVE